MDTQKPNAAAGAEVSEPDKVLVLRAATQDEAFDGLMALLFSGSSDDFFAYITRNRPVIGNAGIRGGARFKGSRYRADPV